MTDQSSEGGIQPPQWPAWPPVARPVGWFLQPAEADDAAAETNTGAEPSAAQSGRPGGPGFSAAWNTGAGANGYRSPWERAQDVWLEAGISWEQDDGARPPDEYDAPDEYDVPPPEAAWPPEMTRPPQATWPSNGDTGVGMRRPPTFGARAQERPLGEQPVAHHGADQAAGFSVLGAPTMADAYEPWRVRHPDLPVGPVRRTRRNPTLRFLRVVIPVAVIAAVGIGAVMMLTGRANTLLARSAGDTRNVGSAGRNTSSNNGAMGTQPNSTMNMNAFPGTASGPSAVAGLASNGASSGATLVAVGVAQGGAAIWMRTANSWSLAAKQPGLLTSVTYGSNAWIATGRDGDHSLVMTSADGRHWQVVSTERAFTRYSGEHIYGAAAGSAGYVVVGKIQHHGRAVAADWWSTNLKYWVRGGNGGLDGRQSTSQMRAAVATPGGFVVVGQHGRDPAAWMSGTAHDWMLMDLPMPAGASNAMLTQAAVHGDRVVAVGTETTAHGMLPFTALSPDGGASWTETRILTPGTKPTVMTAVTYTMAGFVAAGMSGTTAYYWTSTDGTTWSHPSPAGSGITVLTGLAADGSRLAGVGEMMGRPLMWTR